MHRVNVKIKVSTAMSFLLALFCIWAAPANAGGYLTGNELYAVCLSQDPVELAQCDGYLQGVADLISDVQSNNSIKSNICFRNGVTTQQLSDVLTNYMGDHPETRDYVAADQVFDAFSQAFPCS